MVTTMIIYILDDDKTELFLWKHAIPEKRPNWAIRTFETAKDFKAACTQETPNIAILDLVLNLENGVDVCKWLIKNYPEVTTYVNTSMDGDEFKILAERCGANYLCKSTHFNERLKVIINGGS